MLLFILSANAQLFKESGIDQVKVSPQILESVAKMSRQPVFKSTRRVQMASPVEFKQLTRDKKLGFAVPG
ncbi:MAG: hypothetical protein EAZ91_24565 [Cytophagales bacterium]|nr:MAG: hypothetical protein EAZ91_24565 [Cytophagales bacterium]